ncbi:hypothetical protein BGX34_007435 [Mortierella sp. NVP85]|nr:hypothetical protein BGX34_007435 [Mortierella sp. NVP85]
MSPRNRVRGHASSEPYFAAAPALAAAAPTPDKHRDPKDPKPKKTTAVTVTATTTLPTTTTTTTVVPTSTGDISSVAPPVSVPSGSSRNRSESSSDSNRTGLIAGVVAGVIVLVMLVAGLMFRAKRRRQRSEREAELYQQRTMMQKCSEGSSTIGYGDDSDQPLRLQQYNEYRLQQMGKQPAWFGKKSPLEYYSQVPPLEELRRQEQYRPSPLTQELSYESTSSSSHQGSSSSSGPSAQQGAMAVRSLAPSNTNTLPSGELIALGPAGTQHQQHYQPSRISTHGLQRPQSQTVSTPIIPSSSTSNNNNSLSPFQKSPLSAGYSGTSSKQPANNASNLYSYTPPPPSAEPFKLISLSTLPPPGFYDLLDSDFLKNGMLREDGDLSPTSPSGSTPRPPPVPKSTRPNSAASTPLTSMEMRSEASAPDVPSLPNLPSFPPL